MDEKFYTGILEGIRKELDMSSLDNEEMLLRIYRMKSFILEMADAVYDGFEGSCVAKAMVKSMGLQSIEGDVEWLRSTN